MVDFILIRNNWKNSVQNCETYINSAVLDQIIESSQQPCV